MTCAPGYLSHPSASMPSRVDLPLPVGPMMSVWPTSPTARCRRKGVEPVVLQ